MNKKITKNRKNLPRTWSFRRKKPVIDESYDSVTESMIRWKLEIVKSDLDSDSVNYKEKKSIRILIRQFEECKTD